MNIRKLIASAAAAFAVSFGTSAAVCAATYAPPTGNTESKTYLWVFILTGVDAVAAGLLGMLKKKKK